MVPCFLFAIWTISSRHETARPLIGTWYHLDNFILTWQLSPVYRDWQKSMAPRRRRQLIKPPGR
jgi:hypothetical protein